MALVMPFCLVALSGCTTSGQKNLIPDTPGTSPNYWCSWAVQNYMHGQGDDVLDPIVKTVAGIGRYKSDYLTEETLFGPNGWATTFHTKIRNDLYIVLDDGWDIPTSNDYSYRTFSRLDPEKFPSFKGNIPENLIQLNQWARDRGWRGMGLWFRDVESGQDSERRTAMHDDKAYERLYWGERLEWCRDAGINYWKMDVGGNDEKMRMFQNLVREKHPGLHFEIGVIPKAGAFNSIPGNGRIEEEYRAQAVEKLSYTEILRLYDISPELGNASMLERFARVVKAASENPAADGLLNCEEEVYIAAALGGTMGIFRHSMVGLRPGGDPDLYLTGPRNLKRRLDEVVRAVMWQRIAPAFSASSGAVQVDDEYMMDFWKFSLGEFWASAEDWHHTSNVVDKVVEQYAPARVSRGLPLPDVSIEGEPPFVLASRHPNGAVSVASIGRVSPEKGYYTPEADVTIEAGALNNRIGIFGYYRSLTVIFNEPLGKVRIWGQDLAGDRALDITDRLMLEGNRLVIPGDVISEIGLSAASENDLSDPGMVIGIEKR